MATRDRRALRLRPRGHVLPIEEGGARRDPENPARGERRRIRPPDRLSPWAGTRARQRGTSEMHYTGRLSSRVRPPVGPLTRSMPIRIPATAASTSASIITALSRSERSASMWLRMATMIGWSCSINVFVTSSSDTRSPRPDRSPLGRSPTAHRRGQTSAGSHPSLASSAYQSPAPCPLALPGRAGPWPSSFLHRPPRRCRLQRRATVQVSRRT